MALRLNGSSSGFVALESPASAGSNTITLPTSNGSANQFLKNGSAAGTLVHSGITEDSSGNLNFAVANPVIGGGSLASLKITAPDGGSRYFFGELANDKSAQLSLYNTSDTQKVRIAAGDGGSDADTFFTGGKVGIGTSSPAETFHVKGFVSAFERTDVASATHERLCSFKDGGGTERGTIKVSNASTQFNTSSDYRLKENQVLISDGITRLKTLKPYQFNFKQNPGVKVDGFFAHEVTAVPEAISGTKDQVVVQSDVDNGEYSKDKLGDPIYQGIDQSKLIPLLTAALQEAISKIETLETKVAALEAA